MKTQSKFAKLAVLTAMAALSLSLSTRASAESEAARAIRAAGGTVPTNISGIRAYAEPPKGFNAVTASDEDLATYGFPARPDKEADPDRYARWERVVKAAKVHWNGELKALPFSGRALPPSSSPLPQAVQSQAGPQQGQNINASGVVINNTLKTWNDKTSFQEVNFTVAIPTAQLPLSNPSCTASDYKTFTAAGIDSSIYPTSSTETGFVPGLQGGVYADVPCGGGSPFYFAEFGFGYPLYRSFAINPGDVVYVEVTVNSAGSAGDALFFDSTSGAFDAYTISTPGLIGKNGGWLVFRPCCDASGNNFPLANTVNIFLQGIAYNGANKEFYPGSQATSTQVLTMTDDLGDQAIEQLYQGSAGAEGLTGLTFYTNNCAYSGGCTP